MRKTIWIARDGGAGFDDDQFYVVGVNRPRKSLVYRGIWMGEVNICKEVMHRILAPADRLKPGEGPKRIKIKLGG